MRKLYIVAFATIITGGIIFSACQKDENVVTNTKMLKSTGSDNLKIYELYTPEENSIEGKLLLMTGYVNNPDENAMPDMELKEAIWFMEMFFNIGICQKQEYAVDTANLSEIYSMTISLSENDETNLLYLNGQELQTAYIDLLQGIVEELSSNYTINFGDIYVHNITNEEVTIHLEIIYGKKGYELTGFPPAFPIRKIVSKTFSPVIYPYRTSGYIYRVYSVVKDEGMTITLNQERETHCPVGIIGVRAMTDNANKIAGYYSTTKDYGDVEVWMTDMIYNKHGNNYRDVIWNDLEPIALSGYSSDYKPLWAGCYLHREERNIASSYKNFIYHNYGIEKICTYFLPSRLSRLNDIKFHPAGIL